MRTHTKDDTRREATWGEGPLLRVHSSPRSLDVVARCVALSAALLSAFSLLLSLLSVARLCVSVASVGHKGKFGHEFLEFEFRPDGLLRYANNSNYKKDTIIRKEGEVAHTDTRGSDADAQTAT